MERDLANLVAICFSSETRVESQLECKQILQQNLQDIWHEFSYVKTVNMAKKFTTIPEISNFSQEITFLAHPVYSNDFAAK